MDDAVTLWPDLPYNGWRETAATLQLWTQIVGQVRLTLTRWLNGWQVPPMLPRAGLAPRRSQPAAKSSGSSLTSSAIASSRAPAGARTGIFGYFKRQCYMALDVDEQPAVDIIEKIGAEYFVVSSD